MKRGRPLLWLACRKRIDKVILSHVSNALKIETSRSSNIKIFKRFRDKGLNATPRDIATLHTNKPEEFGKLVTTQSTKVKESINHEREVQSYTRGDHKELLDLTEAYTNNRNGIYKFASVGLSTGQDGWRSNCMAVMVMLQDLLPSGIASKAQIKKIERFVNFCTFVFNEWWLNGLLAASAPRNDLELFKNIKHFAEVVAALKAFNRHTWYLTGKLIPLVFWDESVSFAEKEALSAALLNLSPNSNPTMLKRCGNGFVKLVLPDIKSQHATMSLSHYINEDSGKIFQFVHIP